jgi:hypothetical protein
LIGRGDNARRDPGVAGCADPAEGAVLKNAKELGLELEREFSDLVEKERSAMSGREQPGSIPLSAGEGALGVAEELSLDEGLGERRAVDGDKRPSRTPGGMEGLGNDLLADSGFSFDEDRQIDLGQALNLVDERAHGRALGDEFSSPVGAEGCDVQSWGM